MAISEINNDTKIFYIKKVRPRGTHSNSTFHRCYTILKPRENKEVLIGKDTPWFELLNCVAQL